MGTCSRHGSGADSRKGSAPAVIGAGASAPAGRVARARLRFAAERMFAVAADVAAIAFAYVAAFALRFDFQEPPWGWPAVARSFAVACAVQLFFLFAFGCHARPWRRTRAQDAARCVLAMAASCAALTAMRFFLPNVSFSHVRPPYSVTLVCFVFGTAGTVLVRLSRRALWESRRGDGALIERAEATFDNAPAARFLAGRTVMVTGAGGSIGSEIVRQTAAAGARRVVMVERCENALYEIDRAMRSSGLPAELRPVMADVADEASMERIFAEERPSVVLHAAACKHVPMVELNPEEGWRNNVGGTKTLAELSGRHGVERFVLVSTDKAVNPLSAMGRSKKAAEDAVMAMDGSRTSFCAVRFGNVYGSSGSVVPLFAEQIAKGGPVTVTHPDMKRYFMTVQEAVGLVLQAATRSERAIYTLDMGEPVRILDLAEHMISRAGYRPYVDIAISFTGIRPGEKLFEEIDVSEKSAFKTDMAKIYITRRGA